MFIIGLDLGQRQDFSAIAVVERRMRKRAYQAAVFHSLALRRIERVALGTPYPKVVERCARDGCNTLWWKGIARWWWMRRGVGGPVVDLLRQAQRGMSDFRGDDHGRRQDDGNRIRDGGGRDSACRSGT